MRRFIAAQPLAAPVSAPDLHRVPACVKDFIARQPLKDPRFDVEILCVPRQGTDDI